jgi:parallel beta-helix repeat protein
MMALRRFGWMLLAATMVPAATLAADYFVAPNGSDGNPGTSGVPWRSVTHAANVVQAGDTVTVRPGTYVESPWLATSGTPGDPITFWFETGAVMVSPDPAASEEAFNLAGVGHVRIVGIEATGGFHETVFLRPGSHDIEISGCSLYANRVGIVLADAFNVTISGCTMHNNIRTGIRIAGTSHDVTVSDTESFSNDDGLACDGDADGFTSDRTPYNITFVRTSAHHNGEDGYDMPAASVVLDQVESYANTCSGLKLWSTVSVSNCLVYGNRTGVAATSITGNTTTTIANCTVQGNGLGLVFKPSLTTGARYNVNVFNNILVGPDHVLDFYDTVDLYEAHNVLWRGDQYGALIQQLSSSTGRLRRRYRGHDVNRGIWQRGMRQGGGTFSVDPQLSAFVPAITSAAIDRARRDAAPFTDFNGDPRPQGNGADIGAIEIPNGVTNHPPIADAGLPTRVGLVNRRLAFNSLGSVDPDGGLLTFTWDFGDGSAPVVATRPLHTFTAAGTYTVTMTASDGALSGQATITVTIR